VKAHYRLRLTREPAPWCHQQETNEDSKSMRHAEENPYGNRAKQKLEQCRNRTKDKRMTWQQGTKMQSSRPGGNSVKQERNPNQENDAPVREKL
jgi:hypothetical protein